MDGQLEAVFFGQHQLLQDVEKALDTALLSQASVKKHLEGLRALRYALCTQKGCEDRLEHVNSLIHECKRRLINDQIDKVAEKAQSLLGKKADQEMARKLRKKILALCTDHALSFENRQMVLFVRKMLQKVDPNGKMLRLPHNDEFGVEAFEIAHLLYSDRLGEAKRALLAMPRWFSLELDDWIIYAGSKLENIENIPDLNVFYREKWAMIRGLIGFATGELPSLEEAKGMFSELESILETA